MARGQVDAEANDLQLALERAGTEASDKENMMAPRVLCPRSSTSTVSTPQQRRRRAPRSASEGKG